MTTISRADTSVLGRWWWTVDRWALAAIAAIAFVGIILILAASPAVAQRLHLDGFYFVRRQFALLAPALAFMIAVSLLSPLHVRRLAVVGLALGIGLLVLTFFHGVEIKGARRWIALGSFSLQPSEFVKPCFAVISAWMLAEQKKGEGVPGNLISGAIYAVLAGLLLLQPDLGMAVVVTAIWFAQLFLAGLPIVWVIAMVVLGVGGLGGAYLALPHVASRIDRFLDKSAGDSFQVSRSLAAFRDGGLWGRAPGKAQSRTSSRTCMPTSFSLSQARNTASSSAF